MSRPFVSVVMPVYGVEKYLEESVRSVLGQTEPSFEIILVDDCSPDSSPKICDRLAQEDARIKVLHLEKNVGLSEARNTGFKHVRGEYVFFMDSDDTIDSDLLKSFREGIKKNPAEVTIFGIKEQYYNYEAVLENEVELLYGQELYLTDKRSVRKEAIELENKTFLGYAWNKIYNVEYLRKRNITFNNITLIEDILFNIEVFRDLESLNILNLAPYHYKKRMNQSLTAKFVADYFVLHRKRIQSLYDLHNEWGMLTDYVKNVLANLFVRYIFSALQRNCDKRANMNHALRKKFLHDIYEDELFIKLIPYANSENKTVAIMCAALSAKKIEKALTFGRIIFIIKEKLPILFSRLKQKK